MVVLWSLYCFSFSFLLLLPFVFKVVICHVIDHAIFVLKVVISHAIDYAYSLKW